MTKATLKFGPGESSGFAGIATAPFNNAPPARILRELLQNSLDAAVEAGEKTAVVRFEVSVLERAAVPDFDGYKSAFRAAVDYHRKRNDGRLSDPGQQVVDTIENALGGGDQYLLSVFDNGVGFDERRMTAVLGDGSGAKDAGAAGSYGVGHFSAVAASDLRYLLYGGVSDRGRRIASGFTIIASRPGRRHPLSARGHLVKKLLGGEEGPLFKFASGKDVPALVGRALSRIRKEQRHGSVVMIPSFNYFRLENNRSLTTIVPLVAAINFSASIHAGELVVEVDETAIQGGHSKRVDAGNLRELLETVRERKRAFRSDSWLRGLRPSGQNAWAAYQVLSEGRQALVPTMAGNMDVHLLVPAPLGTARVDLFRNGMWITDAVPELSPTIFGDWEAFHAVIMPRPKTELHRLIRKAEGPMHDEISLKLLNEDIERDLFRTALRAIASWLRNEVPKLNTKTYTPDDFLVVSSGDSAGVGAEGRFAMWGSPVVVRHARLSQQHTTGATGATTAIEPDGPGIKGRPKRRRQREAATKRTRPLPFRSTGVPGGRGQYNIEIECAESVEEVILRFRIDENTDVTSDRLWPDEEVELTSFAGSDADGAPLAADLEDDRKSIRLRRLKAGTYNLAISYDAPSGFDEAVRSPVFRVDLHKP